MKILIGIPKNKKAHSRSGVINFAATMALALGIVYISTSPAMKLIERADALNAKSTADVYTAGDESAQVLKPAVIRRPDEVKQIPEEESADADDVAAFIEAMHIPLDGRITSEVGEREDPFGSGMTEYHSGTDIAVTDDYAIRAAEGGTVERVSYDNGYGNYIIIDHGGGIRTLYAHCEYIYLEPGDSVHRGMLIAKAGMTGRATGVHLHFEILTN